LKRTALYCLISGILGGLVAVALSSGPNMEPSSVAQEPGGGPVPGPAAASPLAMPVPPVDPPPLAPAPVIAASPNSMPVLPNPMGGSEYTAEERVNIWVYEQANRSVVNITTKGYQGERVLLFDVISEGEGSGAVIDRQGHI